MTPASSASRSEGMELREALVQAGLVRLRAVLVTVLTTVGSLVPRNLIGGEPWRPLTGSPVCHVTNTGSATGALLHLLRQAAMD